VPVTVRVKNSGKRDGDEVIQLYVSAATTAVRVPLKALKAFQRVALKAGQSKIVRFSLSPEDLSIIDDDGNAKEFSGKVTISAGGMQPGTNVTSTSNVVSTTINIL